jgi:hypothetical protein
MRIYVHTHVADWRTAQLGPIQRTRLCVVRQCATLHTCDPSAEESYRANKPSIVTRGNENLLGCVH